MISTLYILLVPISILFPISFVLPSILALWFLNLYRGYKIKIMNSFLIFLLITALIISVSDFNNILNNLNIFASIFAIVFTSDGFTSFSSKSNTSSDKWIRISILILVLAAIANRFLFYDIGVIELPEIGPTFTIIDGWTRDGLFGANVVGGSLAFLNISLLRKKGFLESLLSLFVGFIYGSRLMLILFFIIFIFQLFKVLSNNTKIKGSAIISILLLLTTLSFGTYLVLFPGSIQDNFNRCAREYSDRCYNRLDKVNRYIESIYEMPLKDNLIGYQNSEIDLKDEVTLSDFSWLEILHSNGLIYFFIFLIALLSNINYALRNMYIRPEVLVIEIIFLLFLSTYTIIRMVPLVLLYCSTRKYLNSQNNHEKSTINL
ncbi:hypothetical protein [Prochlorococcus marinus]|uniref:hypothetical protein n=1 Tax=Prochlorococcus marinus TaxID=1219 RepID=UPI0002DF6794|nr:hypothetical protein [Prochlorococcus marinus]